MYAQSSPRNARTTGHVVNAVFRLLGALPIRRWSYYSPHRTSLNPLVPATGSTGTCGRVVRRSATGGPEAGCGPGTAGSPPDTRYRSARGSVAAPAGNVKRHERRGTPRAPDAHQGPLPGG